MSDEVFRYVAAPQMASEGESIAANIKPERALFAAILVRAIMDLTGPIPEEAEEARDWIYSEVVWLNSPLKEQMSFCGVCKVLDIDPKRMKIALTERLTTGLKVDIRNRKYNGKREVA